jgi:uracil-DNA glycosylase
VPLGYSRKQFFELAKKSMTWLEREISLAQPRLLITLGNEVAGVLHNVRSASAQTKLLKPEIRLTKIGTIEVPAVHCAHPGILMRRGGDNPWPERHNRRFVPFLRKTWRKP